MRSPCAIAESVGCAFMGAREKPVPRGAFRSARHADAALQSQPDPSQHAWEGGAEGTPPDGASRWAGQCCPVASRELAAAGWAENVCTAAMAGAPNTMFNSSTAARTGLDQRRTSRVAMRGRSIGLYRVRGGSESFNRG